MQEKRPWDGRLLERMQREGRAWEKPVRRPEVLFAIALALVVVILSIVLTRFLWFSLVLVLFYVGQLRARWWRTRRRGPEKGLEPTQFWRN
jgi:hypothetical protein